MSKTLFLLTVLLAISATNGFLSKKPKSSLNTYDFTGSYQGGAGTLVTINQVSAISSPKKAVVRTNFQPTSVNPSCFASFWGNTDIAISQDSGSYLITVTPKDSGNLNLDAGCGIFGGNKVFSDVQYGVVQGVSVDDLPITIADSYNVKPGNGKMVVGYYTNWARYSKKYPASKIPLTQYNQIQYAFIGFDGATGGVFSLDSWAEINEMPTLAKARIQYPYLNVALSFGGWTNSGKTTAPMFDLLTNSQSKINTFAQNAVRTMRLAGYNGIDIDWEWWSDYTDAPADKQLALYRALRKELDAAGTEDNTHYTLSIAVVSGYDKIVAGELQTPGSWKQISDLVDYINIMSYDMHGAYDPLADFQAPFGMEEKSPYFQTKYDIKECLDVYIKYGVQSTKINLGVPAYGRSMIVKSLDNFGLYQTVLGTPSGDYDAGDLTGVFLYKCIVEPDTCYQNGDTIRALSFVNQKSTAFKQFSLFAQEPWGYGATPQGNVFLSYDNVETIQYKANQSLNYNLGGMMLWEIDGDVQDNTSLSIVYTINAVFNA